MEKNEASGMSGCQENVRDIEHLDPASSDEREILGEGGFRWYGRELMTFSRRILMVPRPRPGFPILDGIDRRSRRI